MQQSHHFGRIPALFHAGSMAEYHEYDLRCILATYVSLRYAGPRNIHSFGDIYELPSVQNDVEDVLPPNNRLAEGARGGSDSTVSTATHPRRRRSRCRRVRSSESRIALERTVGVSGSSNLAHMFAESRGVIHFHSAITSSSHTILAQVNSPTEMGGALTEPVAPVPTSHYRAGLDGPNIIHTLGNFARLRLYEPDEPVPTADEHNNQLSGMESFGDIDQIPRVQGTRFGPGPSHGPTR